MKKVILIIIMHQSIAILAGNIVIDSLLSSLPKSEGIKKVDIMCNLCWEYRFIDPDTALYYGETARELAMELDYEKGIAQAFNDVGILFIDKGDYNKALDYFGNSLEIRLVLQDSTGIGSLYNKIGIVYQKKGQLKESLDNAIKALEIYEKLNQELWVGYCLNNIAIINYNLGNLKTSLDYHERALELRKKQNDKYGEAGSYSNIANVYLEIGDTVQAISNYEKALKISRELELQEPVSVMLTNLGSVYLYKAEYEKAKLLLEESLKIREQLGDKKAISSSVIKLGQVYCYQGNYNRAKEFLYRGLQISQDIGTIEEERQACLELSRLYKKTDRPDSAFKYLELYSALSDSVYNYRLEQQIIEAQTKYDSDKKDQELELLHSENELNEFRLRQRRTEILLLIFIIISLVGAGIFVIYRRKQQQQHALDLAEIEHNKQQIDAVLAGQEEERRKIARELHDGVGQSLSGVKLKWESVSYKLAEKDVITDINELTTLLDEAANEIRTISHQMLPKELEQFGLVSALNGIVLFANETSDIEFSFTHFKIDKRFDPQLELALFRITQELISNVHKHSGATEVSIQLLRRNNNLVYIMEDNGKGFDYEMFKGKGIGLLNIETRVSGINGVLNYETEAGKGTIVTIRIPL